MLRQLLERLDGLLLTRSQPALQIVVVDNDPGRSGEQACMHAREALRWPLRYLCEPRRGIPFVRNTALAAVVDECDFVVFIDDDEVPEPQWLDALLAAQRQHDADVVAGPVESILPPSTPEWVRRGGLFDHTRHRTGDAIESCGTGNVLIATRALQRVRPWFDERLALTGGSDRHFFLRLHQAGCRMVWCDEAMVAEEVPESRVNLQWLLRRMYRQGICNGFCDVDLHRGPAPRLRTGVAGAAFVGGGLGLLPIGAVRGKHLAVRYMRYVAYGAGLLQSLRGKFHDEYATVHGG